MLEAYDCKKIAEEPASVCNAFGDIELGKLLAVISARILTAESLQSRTSSTATRATRELQSLKFFVILRNRTKQGSPDGSPSS